MKGTRGRHLAQRTQQMVTRRVPWSAEARSARIGPRQRVTSPARSAAGALTFCALRRSDAAAKGCRNGWLMNRGSKEKV
jgi:hypothetical protein